MQKFSKSDELEQKIIDSMQGLFTALNLSYDDMETGLYSCHKIGELIYDNNRMPVIYTIQRAIFIRIFMAIFEAWANAGTFESYILLFKKIFGEVADIEFSVPARGQLHIGITGPDIESFILMGSSIVDSQYVLDEIIDEDENNIIGIAPIGIESEYELSQVMFAFVPNGIYTTISLSLE